jgi:xanthine dehydrogenase accessory factor
VSLLRDLLEERAAWGFDVPVGRAVVIRTFGSSPWPEGATLLVAEDGRRAGTVSGGCIEADASEQVRDAISRGATRTVHYGVADETAWSVGLACGGGIDLLIEPEVRPELVEAAHRSDGRALAIPLPDDAWSAPRAVLALPPSDAFADARAGVLTLDDGEYFVERFAPRSRLVIFGAGEVTYRLVELARAVGWETVVVDPRATLLDPVRLAGANRVVDAWPQDAAAEIELNEHDAVVVLTHDPKLDDPALELALARGCRYVGAIGSRRTQADRRRRLREARLSEEAVRRVRGPVGLDLGAREPGEVALAILAEVVAARHGATSRPLSEM